MTTGALPGLLHPQRRQRPGAPAHRQHLHEPAEAARVLRPEPDEEQAVVRHRVVLRVRAELRRSGGKKSAWVKRTKRKLARREGDGCTDVCVFECLRGGIGPRGTRTRQGRKFLNGF